MTNPMFPQRNWFGQPKGWKDLGKTPLIWVEVADHRVPERAWHDFCHKTLHLGKEGDTLFKFCPRCEVKVK